MISREEGVEILDEVAEGICQSLAALRIAVNEPNLPSSVLVAITRSLSTGVASFIIMAGMHRQAVTPQIDMKDTSFEPSEN